MIVAAPTTKGDGLNLTSGTESSSFILCIPEGDRLDFTWDSNNVIVRGLALRPSHVDPGILSAPVTLRNDTEGVQVSSVGFHDNPVLGSVALVEHPCGDIVIADKALQINRGRSDSLHRKLVLTDPNVVVGKSDGAGSPTGTNSTRDGAGWVRGVARPGICDGDSTDGLKLEGVVTVCISSRQCLLVASKRISATAGQANLVDVVCINSPGLSLILDDIVGPIR
mmetsp:Transcript_6460/g.12819  ORF Transcript_6460/g.12819 Transcript_6460/m.12819 type:complete len:224 (+) Transcript_6460:16935-17606(+)